MALSRRAFMYFLGGSLGVVALHQVSSEAGAQPARSPRLTFQPVRGPMPLPTAGLAPAAQKQAYATYEVLDDLVLPEGFTYDVLAAWGEPLGDSRVGYNHDYLSYVPTGANQGYLTINFEYISARTWFETFEPVIGKRLPIQSVQQAVAATAGRGINAFELAEADPLKAQIRQISEEALTDLGIGVISVEQGTDGRWQRINRPADRRITGLSGLRDGRYLKTTGPAVAIFRKTQGRGYIDGLGDQVIGTFANCAGGTTPWGTVLSAEENFHFLVPEPVFPDGTPLPPSARTFTVADGELAGQGNVFGLAGHKYGWIVEVDPSNPQDWGTKHTGLGRFRHEAVGIRVMPGKPLAFYSGCDRRGGHVYKFVSCDPVQDPKDKRNSRLLENGRLWVAKFLPGGQGRWIPLEPNTPVDPDLPSALEGGLLLLPSGKEARYLEVREDQEVTAYRRQFTRLGDLYEGAPEERLGAILIDAHYAANAAGGTCTARPEDTMVAPDGTLFITFTSGAPSQFDGGPDRRIFLGPQGQTAYEPGWVMRLQEANNDMTADTFTWSVLAYGGEPSSGGAGFANPDNLEVTSTGNLWMVTDMSGSRMNAVRSVPNIGRFGNNGIWVLPTAGREVGNAYLFGLGPMDAEVTGPFFTPDQKTLFLAVQHPGEMGGTRQEGATRAVTMRMLTTDGEAFQQLRRVPVGSNWPAKTPNAPPRPAVVAVRRLDGQPFA
ncbi:MAG: DUF839 domain-containing protein [Gloeomargaritaceae cyanobacterium C42_A2020_066]|nr:DUF839 domain-containing protein [Gloeomargaritaceae cyanobacterium C42_A2020_066]